MPAVHQAYAGADTNVARTVLGELENLSSVVAGLECLCAELEERLSSILPLVAPSTKMAEMPETADASPLQGELARYVKRIRHVGERLETLRVGVNL